MFSVSNRKFLLVTISIHALEKAFEKCLIHHDPLFSIVLSSDNLQVRSFLTSVAPCLQALPVNLSDPF